MTKQSTVEHHQKDGTIVVPGVSRRGFVAGATAAVRGHRHWRQRLPTREAQSGKPKAFWPNGARLAIAFSMVIETDADPDPTPKGPDGKTYPNLYAKTAEQYAAQRGHPAHARHVRPPQASRSPR